MKNQSQHAGVSEGWKRRGRGALAGAVAAFGVMMSTAEAVQFSAQVLVDTELEFSGIWSARVGYFGENRTDEPGSVTLFGVIPGSTIELRQPNPYHGVFVELYDDTLVKAQSLSFDGVWSGEGWGAGSELLEGFEYELSAEYSFGGFNEPRDPSGPSTDAMWGYWDGTFSIRQVGAGNPVPEPATALVVLELGLALAFFRRSRPS
jgi:hypothetical protein